MFVTETLDRKKTEALDCLPVTGRFYQYINWIVFKYNEQYPNYLNEVSKIAPENNIQTRGS